ncbi:MAG: tetratricopeptide repeat protein, partial [Gemmatimonadetes bacterium]|nr:tetratricopeptide repeat protein [Gemmatimonadota bacterium]
ATAALVAALVLGTTTTLWQAHRARVEAERGRAVGAFVISLFEGADPDLHPEGPVTARDLLVAGAARVDSLAAAPATRVDLLTTLGSLLGKVGDYDGAETLLDRAVGEARAGLPASDPGLARALDELGVRRTLTGDAGLAEPALREALALRVEHAASPDEIAATEGNLAAAYRNLGRLDEAAALYRSAIDRLAASTGGDSLAFASELMGLGQVLQDQGRLDDAEAAFRTVLRLHERAGLEIPFVAIATHNL